MKRRNFTRRKFINTFSIGSLTAAVSSAIPSLGFSSSSNNDSGNLINHGRDESHNDCSQPGLKLSTFDVDATPPVGTHLASVTMSGTWDLGIRAKGIVLYGAGQPIVLCSIDWIGISNEGQDVFKQALADAAKTTPSRIAVHTVHQHYSPVCDFAAEGFLKKAGLDTMAYEGTFARELICRLETAVRNASEIAQPVTHIGLGEAPVHKVASNRRILGPDGKVRETRWTVCRDPALRAEPEGLIDPMVSLVSLWNNDIPLTVLSYYAVHPQSYYDRGIPNPDFPGIARFYRQLEVPQALHVHFNGAGGNIGAGKYNDGSKENRGILANRLADGMKRAWECTKREPLTTRDVVWNFESVALPHAGYIKSLPTNENLKDLTFIRNNIRQLIWLQRCQEGKKIDVGCLSLRNARILHLPGELCVEYQLAAKASHADLFVAMAAYGDYGPGYICTANAYKQGGYEDGPDSYVSPDVEKILMNAINKLLANDSH